MIVINKKRLILFITIIFIAVFLIIGILNISENVFGEKSNPMIILDAGHGRYI